MRVGIDLVYIPEFVQKLKHEHTCNIVFTDDELTQFMRLESRAGVFAAKEACMKALGQKIDWKEIWLEKDATGKPFLYCSRITSNCNVELSISHSNDYATAIVLLN